MQILRKSFCQLVNSNEGSGAADPSTAVDQDGGGRRGAEEVGLAHHIHHQLGRLRDGVVWPACGLQLVDDGPAAPASDQELPLDKSRLSRPLLRQLLHLDVRAGEVQTGLLQIRPVLLSLLLGLSFFVMLFQLGQHHDQGHLDSSVSTFHFHKNISHLFIKYHFPKCFNARNIIVLPQRSLGGDVFQLTFRKFDPGGVDVV